MAASRDGGTALSQASMDAPDADWLTLTEGMDDYERFRFIARHILLSAIDDARAYVTDERIFADIDDREALAKHLEEMDRELREDRSLSAPEREFLCAAVAEAMRELEMAASCPWHELARLAAASRSDRASTES